MAYERDYKKTEKEVLAAYKERPKLPSDLCCDGCGEHCKLDLRLEVENLKYKPRSGEQKFVIKTALFAGDKKLYNESVFASVKHFANEITVNFDGRNAEALYRNALVWCRMTCKHSKVR